MHDRTDQNAVAILGVEHDVRLKPKAPESGLEEVGGLSDAGKVREQTEGAFQPGKVGVGLIAAETRFAIVVDCDKLGPGAVG